MRPARTFDAVQNCGYFVETILSQKRLGERERSRHGLTELRLNVLRVATPTQPEPSAIINLKKVYVGEVIPDTRARLIGVQSRSIAIEIEGTGERYRVM